MSSPMTAPFRPRVSRADALGRIYLTMETMRLALSELADLLKFI